jgi:aryl-alcohol dehydrogenase-like predicted oxidoreductase
MTEESDPRLASPLGLGTAQFAFKDESRDVSIATVHAAVDAGIQLIDTALAYTRLDITSYAESIVRAALAARPQADVLVATKGGHRRVGNSFPIDGRPSSILADCEESLRALGVETLDSYQLHHVDPAVPIEDSVGAMLDLQRQGKVRMIGLSNVSVEQVERARAVATIVSVQNRLSITVPGDLPTARYCEVEGIRYLAYQPLEGVNTELRESDARRIVAERHGVSVQQVAIAWLRAMSPAITPLVGASRPSSIQDSAAARHLRLHEHDLAALERN